MKFSSYNQFKSDLSAVGIEYAAEHARACGFEGVELLDAGLSPDTRHFLSADHDLSAIKAALQKNGLQVACYSAYADIFADDRESLFQKIQHMIDCAAFLESPMFHHTIIPGFRSLPSSDAPLYDDVFDEAIERVCTVAEFCKQKGIHCIYEPQGFYFNGITGLKRLFDAVRRENIGFCADMANSLCVDEDPADVFAAFADKTRHVHIKNYSVSARPISGVDQFPSLGGKYLCNAPLFGGNVSIEKCLKILKSSAYDGFASLEFPADDATTTELLAQLKHLWERL